MPVTNQQKDFILFLCISKNPLTPGWSCEATPKHVKKLLLQKIRGRFQILEGVVVWQTLLHEGKKV